MSSSKTDFSCVGDASLAKDETSSQIPDKKWRKMSKYSSDYLFVGIAQSFVIFLGEIISFIPL